MIKELIVPNLSVNDNELQIFFNVVNGSYVKIGSEIVEFESSKSTAVYPSEDEGYIKFLIEDGDSIKVGTPFALISKTEFTSLSIEKVVSLQEEKDQLTDLKLTKNALEYINNNKIDISLLPKNKLLKREDIENILSSSNKFKAIEHLSINSNSIVIIGAGSLTAIMKDVIDNSELDLIGLLDNKLSTGESIFGIQIIGPDNIETLKFLRQKGLQNIFIGFGATMNHSARMKRFNEIIDLGYQLPNIIHQSSIIHPTVKLGSGIFISTLVSIGPNADIGDACFILDGSLISHDCKLKENVYVSPGATLAGYVSVGTDTLIGMNTTVFYRLSIGNNCKIFNGVNVFDDVMSNTIIKNN